MEEQTEPVTHAVEAVHVQTTYAAMGNTGGLIR